MRQSLESLRRVKHRWVCFDRRIALAERPRRTGWTSDSSPLFDCSQPIHLSVPPGAEQVLSVTLFARPDFSGPFSARMHAESDGGEAIYQLNCRPDWRRYAVTLEQLPATANAATRRGSKVVLTFEGPHAGELRLGELKLERAGDWCLRTEVQGVSFPRSGHHMLVDLLKGYFGSSFQYCGYYETCHQRPCADGVIHLQKNHDHQRDLPSDEDRDYLIQYRHPLPTIISQFEHRLRHDRSGVMRDRADDWRQFAVGAANRWRAWIHKWVLDNRNPRAFMYSYDEVMTDPIPAAARLVRFFDLHDRVDAPLLRRVVRRERVAPRRTLEGFRYFDPAFFAMIEDQLGEELRALKLERPR